MPYSSTDELPLRVRNNLPDHAQDIFLSAYNSAHEQYQDPSKRKANASLEETANRVAWAAVKQEYRKDKDTGQWRKK